MIRDDSIRVVIPGVWLCGVNGIHTRARMTFRDSNKTFCSAR